MIPKENKTEKWVLLENNQPVLVIDGFAGDSGMLMDWLIRAGYVKEPWLYRLEKKRDWSFGLIIPYKESSFDLKNLRFEAISLERTADTIEVTYEAFYEGEYPDISKDNRWKPMGRGWKYSAELYKNNFEIIWFPEDTDIWRAGTILLKLQLHRITPNFVPILLEAILVLHQTFSAPARFLDTDKLPKSFDVLI